MQDYARTLQGHLQGGTRRARRSDLDGSERVEVQHISEAIGYRNLDRGDWAERGLEGNGWANAQLRLNEQFDRNIPFGRRKCAAECKAGK